MRNSPLTPRFICSGCDAKIYVPDALGSTYCPVRSNRKLTVDEVAALSGAAAVREWGD